MRKNLPGVTLTLLAASIFYWISACTKQETEWDSFVEAFIEESFAANPALAVWAGRHEYDGQFPDWSEAGLNSEKDRLQNAREQAMAFDAESLTPTQRFERKYVLAVVDEQIFWLSDADWPHRNPMFYTWMLSPDIYLTREYAPLSDRLRAYITYANNLPTAQAEVRRNLKTPLPRTYVETAQRIFSGMVTLFSDMVPAIFVDVEDAALQAEFVEANQRAIDSSQKMADWLAEQSGNTTEDYAIGAELYQEMLWKTERVDIPLNELKAMAEHDLERNMSALREACSSFATGKSEIDCIQKMMSNKPEAGAVEGARQQLAGLKAFVVEENLVSIPGTEEALVDEAPPHKRWNFAYIAIPGPYEENLPSTYYIAPPNPEWTEQERQDYVPGQADLMGTSIHEVWPGHFLHFLHANRTDVSIGRLFQSYAFTEGWAHYSEEMMLEAGLGTDNPELHVGQLFNALLRDVRFLSSIGLHTEGMSVEESERMFLEYAFQDPGNARQQAARGTFDPGYLNYTLGKLLIRQLREEWTATRGGREAWGEFHNELLRYGAPPVPLVRSIMLGSEADRFSDKD